jgi:sulfur relay (sulfurtransferase) DsrC/TusE family protein
MKIDLTKEEWEFLKECLYETYSQSPCINDLITKLGSEWDDDD